MRHPDLPPLLWLRAFEAAARHLSFTHAGAELNLTQAAISKHVKSLELHLRQELFVRRTRSLSLTKTGAAYLPKVRDAFERLAIGTREVFGKRHATELTLRCAVSFATSWLAPRLPEFFALNPDVGVRIISSVWNDEFNSSIADLDIQYGVGNWSNVKSYRLTHETITPLCTPKLARTIRQPIDLVHHRLIHVLGYQEGWGIWLDAAGVRDINPGQGLHVDTSIVAFQVAAHDGGVVLGRQSLSRSLLETGKLVAPFKLAVPIQEAFFLLEPVGQDVHPDADRFKSWLLDQV